MILGCKSGRVSGRRAGCRVRIGESGRALVAAHEPRTPRPLAVGRAERPVGEESECLHTHGLRDTYARRNGLRPPGSAFNRCTRALHRTRGYSNRTPGPILLYYFYNIVTVSNEIGATGSAGASSILRKITDIAENNRVVTIDTFHAPRRDRGERRGPPST